MKPNLKMERKLEEKMNEFCQFRCSMNEDDILNTIELEEGYIEGVSFTESICSFCQVKNFIRTIRDEI